jgi:Mn2+/Fe2+ NRAMP family transporter
VFTERLGAAFGFAILISVIIDLAAQLNIWRVIAVSGRRAPELAEQVAPGLGTALAVLVALGGLAFNVGNVAGAGLGLQVVFGMPVAAGATLSAVIAIGLFLFKDAGRAMDRFTTFLGIALVALTCYVAFVSSPPVGEAVRETFAPSQIDLLAIVTIVGGTVGGYITFAGAHRLLDAGVQGEGDLRKVTQSAFWAIGIATLMRIVLFLAALGVVSKGLALDPANPPASVFRHATGEVGFRIFGVVMWSAAITSVVGAAYTSVTFLRGLHRSLDARWTQLVTAFIALSTVIYVLIGRPVRTLVLVGALNGLILPLALATMLVAANRSSIVGTYRHPKLLTALGAVVALAMAAAGAYVLWRDVPQLWRGS